MHKCFTLTLCFAALLLARAAGVVADDALDPAQAEFFEKEIRPLLVANCHECHGPDKQEGKLRLDSRDGAVQGGEYGPAIVPEQPDESWLVKAIRYDHEDLQMPPKGKLADEQIEALIKWIKMGAPWPSSEGARPTTTEEGSKITDKDRAFWAFQKVKQPPLPEVRERAWPQSAIDRFILAKLEGTDASLKPVPPADKRTLLRRAYFDLIGLPPTPEEINEFVEDQSPDAFERVLDRLLASPHYGERWGRHWLDVARYGEDQAHTFESRKYPDGFRYRDWVIKALNRDKPYDRFLTEQIAGDLLEDASDETRADRLAALGFFALGPVYYGRATNDELDDRIDTLSRGFLGLTVACARCHDHKFDPIPIADYYSLAGIFQSTQYNEYVLTDNGGIDDAAVSLPTDKRKDKKDKESPRMPVVHSLKEGEKPANMRIHLRGNAENLGDEAPRRFLSILGGENAAPFTSGSGRLELAQAIANPDNPLTARVMVNRVWAQHFGVGIVATPSNFGSLGQPPSHPELLDWLAARFVADGWSLKKLHRQIMSSATYRLSTKHDERWAGIDPDNRLLWRMNRRRLEVEPWRDAMLAVAGNLQPSVGGQSFDLSENKNGRRTLYAAVSRHNLDPVLRLFDYPDPNLTSDRRAVTIVPLQQLFVLNSEFINQQAASLAERLMSESADDASRIRAAYPLVFGREATEQEVELGRTFLQSVGSAEQNNEHSAWRQYAQALLSANEFAFVD